MMLTAIAAAVLIAPTVTVVSTPNHGIQPQAALDAKGNLHLVYFSGGVNAGNLEYVRSTDKGETWTNPIKVNSIANSAVAIGTIRGGQIAVSPSGDIHVVWIGGTQTPGLFYSRKIASGDEFTPQVDMSDGTFNLLGGASVACNDHFVYLVWHASPKDGAPEQDRQLWLRSSRDSGGKFEKKIALAKDQGACAYCSTKAAIDERGRLLALYRSASEGVERDTFSVDWSWSFMTTKEKLDGWRVEKCPMSTFSILPTRPIVRAWETEGRVVVNGQKMPGDSSRHPSLARIDDTVLCAYALSGDSKKPGGLAWALLDSKGKVLESKEDAGSIPTWSLPCAVGIPSRGYLIFK